MAAHSASLSIPAGTGVATVAGMARVFRALEPRRRAPVRPTRAGRYGAIVAFGRRMSRWTAWGAAGMAAVLALAWIASYVADRPLTSYMERNLNARLKGYTASLGRAHFNPFNLSVTLHDVSLRQEANPDPPIAGFPRIWANLEWSSLIWGRLVAKFEFDDPVFYVNRNHFEQEVRDPTPVTERGWQEALEEIYPFKINLLRVRHGTVTYVERGGTRPLELTALFIEARNMRNVRSKDRVYPSDVHVETTVFGRGRAVLDGNADLLAEPHPTFKGHARLDAIALDYFAPVLERYHLAVRRGTLAADASVEYRRDFQNVELRTLEVTGLDADYHYRADAPKPEQAVVQKTKEAARQVSNAPQTRLKAHTIRVTGSVGVVNRSAPPPYRVYVSDLDLTVKNFSNHFSEGPATVRATGRFLGSGRLQLAATFRPETNGPDFDLNVKIEDTDMRRMNDVLRAHGKFDVVQGLFSFYSELRVKNQTVMGYVKPLFRDMNVYDKRQDAEKTAFGKLYERIVGGLSKLLENRTPRQEVATRTTIRGELDGGTRMNTWQALGNLVRNAFFQAILPGLDAERDRGGRGERGRNVDRPGASPRG
jgi:hypothetical protein